MCIDWYYEYTRCGHARFAHREKCNYYRRYGYCDDVGEEYLHGGGTCPPCFRRRLARGVGTGVMMYFDSRK
ncbi:hypothetical protein SLS64_012544 [Diaporthe eres]|uniref:Uncharacterized protein n=1 Tax=Diaporthe eres TaxID=83184 RepID=A0ABR1PF69_DIAER